MGRDPEMTSAWVESETQHEADLVPRPGELWRLAGALAAVRAEVDQLTSLEDAELRTSVAGIERRLRSELEQVVPPSLTTELHALLDWCGNDAASPSELRLGLAQLEGWLGGFISAMGFVVEPPGPTATAPEGRVGARGVVPT